MKTQFNSTDPSFAARSGERDNAGVVALPPLIYGAAFALGLTIHFLLPVQLLPRNLALWIGALLIPVSFAIVASSIRTMDRAKTTHDVRRPSTAVVTNGPFRFSRNPMYLSMMLLYLGVASMINSLWMFLLAVPLVAVMQRGVIKREERYLERKFGEEYLCYKARARRWISYKLMLPLLTALGILTAGDHAVACPTIERSPEPPLFALA